MRLVLIQPPYPSDASASACRATLDFVRARLGELAGKADLVLLPEYANCPGLDQAPETLEKWLTEVPPEEFLAELRELAAEADMAIGAGLLFVEDGRRRNRTVLISRRGELVAAYDKTHLSAAEVALEVVPGDSPVMVTLEGVRISFATCLELYFPEFFERIAALRPDLIIVPSYQRSERCSVLRTQCQARALDTGAHLARISYSMGASAATGGSSLLAAPGGELLLDAGQGTGAFSVEFDPCARHLRPLHHGAAPVDSREILERSRRPELYRPAGPLVLSGRESFPRIVAHRGASGVCPENTLPAFAAALGCGALEVEFDAWPTADGEVVICHDPDLQRTTTGSGKVTERDWEYLRALDAGVKFDPRWKGTGVPRLEDVFELLAGRAFMNVHVKDAGRDGAVLKRLAGLAELWGVTAQVYIAADREVIECAREVAPGLATCCLEKSPQGGAGLIDCALELGCARLQFWWQATTDAEIQRAREAGLVTNYFYVDDPAEAARLIGAGVMAPLTNFPGSLAGVLANKVDD
jgi:glycerophosphoryl diester phosphodiesterase